MELAVIIVIVIIAFIIVKVIITMQNERRKTEWENQGLCGGCGRATIMRRAGKHYSGDYFYRCGCQKAMYLGEKMIPHRCTPDL